MLLYVEDFFDTSPCYLLIVHSKQQRSCVVLVLVLTLLTFISCWLPVLHLVDNAGFVQKNQPVPAVIVSSLIWLEAKFWSWAGAYIWSEEIWNDHETLNTLKQTLWLLATFSHFLHFFFLAVQVIPCWLMSCICVKCLPSGMGSHVCCLVAASCGINWFQRRANFYQTHLWPLEMTNGRII